ncbi:MAG: DNA repair protein RadA [Actinobacteria bacterium]|nr:DNA repair protein RadA [Actinomycetota bacterium]
MARTKTIARCADCGHEEPKWVGRCPGCGGWGTLAEVSPSDDSGSDASVRTSAPQTPTAPARRISEVPLHDVDRVPTGIGELDRVLGGGLVPGVAGLIGGQPGVGKSTLLLQAAQHIAEQGRTVLYVSGEESAGQLRLRAQRLGALDDGVLVAAETSLPSILGLVELHAPDALIIDSIQTVSDPALSSSPGAVLQVRECAAALVRAAKATGTATLLVGHVTKEGSIAGPRVLEHLVDVVLSFEGDRRHALRLLRSVKNRFGAAGEVGCFEMAGDGLREVSDPSRLFLADHDGEPPGVTVTITVEGPRPLAVEIQALVAKSNQSFPRRQATGLDGSRLSMLVAVLERRADVPLSDQELFASAVGGVRVREPAADLALCAAVASSRRDRTVSPGTVILGEVGLAGEVRSVPQLERRLAEAARLGFSRAVIPASYDGEDHGLDLQRVRDVRGALRMVLEPAPAPAAV